MEAGEAQSKDLAQAFKQAFPTAASATFLQAVMARHVTAPQHAVSPGLCTIAKRIERVIRGRQVSCAGRLCISDAGLHMPSDLSSSA